MTAQGRARADGSALVISGPFRTEPSASLGGVVSDGRHAYRLRFEEAAAGSEAAQATSPPAEMTDDPSELKPTEVSTVSPEQPSAAASSPAGDTDAPGRPWLWLLIAAAAVPIAHFGTWRLRQ